MSLRCTTSHKLSRLYANAWSTAVFLAAGSCAAPQVELREATPPAPEAIVSLANMQPGDRVTASVDVSGCFSSATYQVEVDRTAKWAVRITRTADVHSKDGPETRVFELGSAELVELDWELTYARIEHNLRSTSTTEYSLTWKRGEETLAHEELTDGSGGWFNRANLTFVTLFDREQEFDSEPESSSASTDTTPE